MIYVFIGIFVVLLDAQAAQMSSEWTANDGLTLNRVTDERAKNHSSTTLLNWSIKNPASPEKFAFSGTQATSQISSMTDREIASGQCIALHNVHFSSNLLSVLRHQFNG